MLHFLWTLKFHFLIIAIKFVPCQPHTLLSIFTVNSFPTVAYLHLDGGGKKHEIDVLSFLPFSVILFPPLNLLTCEGQQIYNTVITDVLWCRHYSLLVALCFPVKREMLCFIICSLDPSLVFSQFDFLLLIFSLTFIL